jgi:hypothetical protein
MCKCNGCWRLQDDGLFLLLEAMKGPMDISGSKQVDFVNGVVSGSEVTRTPRICNEKGTACNVGGERSGALDNAVIGGCNLLGLLKTMWCIYLSTLGICFLPSFHK